MSHKSHFQCIVATYLIIVFMAGCGSFDRATSTAQVDVPVEATEPTLATIEIRQTESIIPPTATASTTPSPIAQTTTAIAATLPPASPTPIPFLLSEPGPYLVGKRNFDFEDMNRGSRQVGVSIWYPALQPEGSDLTFSIPDAEADYSGGPYPLLICSSKMAGTFVAKLATYGFVVAGIKGLDASDRWGMWLIDYPLDFLFALEQLSSSPLTGLEGILDTERVGTIGFSFDGYNSLAVSGARIDPEFYLAKCAKAKPQMPEPALWWITYICEMGGSWDDFVDHAGATIPFSDDGLWQPMTDDRIRAVMPLAPEGAWLFGERGLAAVDRPTLIIGATRDIANYYNLEAVYIFEHLGTPERTMISFIGESHDMIYDKDAIGRMQHFATAFFGYHLQGRQEWAAYFSEEFVSQYDDLAWGVYTDK